VRAGVASFERIAGSDIDASASSLALQHEEKYTTNQISRNGKRSRPVPSDRANGENRLLVIAGSERVYLNGELMTRGDVNDYIIDYSSGEVTFSSRRLITNASRITIDFEYTDQQFVRNLIAGTVSGKIFSDRLKMNASFVQEADDPDSPIDMTLDDSTRTILKRSGADRMKASVSGITIADSGKGPVFS